MGVRLCNYTDGGEGLANPSPETRLKLVKSHTGKKASEATRLKMSESAKTRGFTDTHKANISKAKLGHKVTQSTREKLRNWFTGRETGRKGIRLSPEHRAKLSLAHKGKTVSERTRRLLSSIHSNGKSYKCRKVIDISTGDIYHSVTECAKKTGWNVRKLNHLIHKQRLDLMPFEFYLGENNCA